jgi:hypothetical protein
VTHPREEPTRAWLIGGPAAGHLIAVSGLRDIVMASDVSGAEHTYLGRKLVLPGHPEPIRIYVHASLQTEAEIFRAVGEQMIADSERMDAARRL